MTRGQYRTLHKWIFIFMGAILLIWCISGMAMMLPMEWFGAANKWSRITVDYRSISVTPAEAVTRLEQHTGTSLEVKNIQLQQIHDQLLYKINTAENGVGLIDSYTGELFQFTPDIAENLARAAFDIEAPLTESTRLTSHDDTYPFGQLPVYRLHFLEGSGKRYFVTEGDARVSRSTAMSRIRAAIVSLHTFQPVEYFTHSPQLRKNLLLLTGALTTLGAIIGYILALPRGRKTKPTAR